MDTLLDIIKSGVENWNKYYRDNNNIKPSFTDQDFSDYDLSGINLHDSTFKKCKFRKTKLYSCDFRNSIFIDCDFYKVELIDSDLKNVLVDKSNFWKANLTKTNFSSGRFIDSNFGKSIAGETIGINTLFEKVDFSECKLYLSNLNAATFNKSNLFKTNFRGASLIGAHFADSILNHSLIYGISAWNLKLTNTKQTNLIINKADENLISVDDIEIGQFIYLILNNTKIRNFIDTLTSKLVLILGRFSPERKAILDKIKSVLRNHNYVPILFDFEKPQNQDFLETISTIAHLSKFIIADFSDPKIILEEVPHIVHNLSIPVKPLLFIEERMPVTLQNLRKFPWVLEPLVYSNENELFNNFNSVLFDELEVKFKEIKAL